MIKVLFVCLGNICRSPLAEGVFAHLVAEDRLTAHLDCDSAGTGDWHVGELPDHRSRSTASAHGIALTHRARQVKGSDFADFDYIFAMDKSNLKTLVELAKRTDEPPRAQLVLLREFDPTPASLEVKDPYFEGEAEFEACYQTVARCAREILAHLKTKHGLG